MGKFSTYKTISLAFVGDDWKDAYIKYRAMTFNESLDLADLSTDTTDATAAKEAADKVLSLLKDHFVEGKGFADGALVDITADDLGDLPVNVITESIKNLGGTADPNS